MRRFTLVLATAVAILLQLHLSSSAATAKDTWYSVRTANFHLVGNASEREIKAVGTRLEQFRNVFSRLFPNIRLASPVPTTVIVFKNDQSFKPFKPVVDGKITDVGGFFQAGLNVNYIALTTGRRSINPYRVIFHEYVHLLIKNTLGHSGVPPWFNEGLAEYYSSFDIQDDRMVLLGRPVFEHLQVLQQSRLLPLKDLLAADYYSLHRNKQDARGLFYAQAWAMVHYLMQADKGESISKLQEFIRLLLEKTAMEEAFRKAFNTDIEGMERNLKAYIQQRAFTVSIATFKEKLVFDSQFQSAKLSEGEAQAYLGDLLYHTERIDEAAERLENALALDPSVWMAHATMGMVRLRQKNFSAAKQHLQKALAGNTNDPLTHYYYSYLLSREYMTEGDLVSDFPLEPANAMRVSLRRAIELKPDFPEAYRLLAFINLVRGEDLDESIGLIRKALSLLPDNETYLFVLAQLYIRKQDLDSARKIVGPLVTGAGDPSIRSTAVALQEAIDSMQDRLDRAKAQELLRSTRVESSVTTEAPAEEQEIIAPVDPASVLADALRKPGAGQVRIHGSLTRIECNSQGIFFTVRSEGRTLRLRTSTFDEILFTTFSSEVRGEVTCGVRKPENPVVIIYVPARDQQGRSDGRPVSLEFVPRDFSMKF